MSPINALITKLQTHVHLDDEDMRALQRLPVRLKDVAARQSIARVGDRPHQSLLVVDGLIMRSKVATRRRQILSIHIPGEIADLQSLFLNVMDHDLSSITACQLGLIEHAHLRALIRERPNITEALWRDSLIDAAIFREWIVNLGGRSSEERAAHLILELKSRLNAIGRGGDEFELPLTQDELGEAIGTTPIHVNRVLKVLRESGLVTFRRHTVKIHDLHKLQELGDFNAIYLHQNPAS